MGYLEKAWQWANLTSLSLRYSQLQKWFWLWNHKAASLVIVEKWTSFHRWKFSCEKKNLLRSIDTKTGVRSDSLSQYFKEDAQIASDCSPESTNQLIDKEIELVDSKKMETSFFLGSNIFQTLHLIIQEASFKRNWKTYVCYKCAKYASVTCSYNESSVLLLFCSNSAKTGSKCFRTKLFLSNSPLLLCPTFLYFFV